MREMNPTVGLMKINMLEFLPRKTYAAKFGSYYKMNNLQSDCFEFLYTLHI